MNLWDETIPPPVEPSVLERNNNSFTIADVSHWVDKHDGIRGHFCFCDAWNSDSQLYQRCMKSLLSLATKGSMDVERQAKPLKHKILTKQRNKLSDGHGCVLLRAAGNLKLLMAEKMRLQGKAYDAAMDIAKASATAQLGTDAKRYGAKAPIEID